MPKRMWTAAVLAATGAAMIGGALGYAPPGQADPGGNGAPPCLAEHTCSLLVPKAPVRYLPLTPAPAAPGAPSTPVPGSG